MYSNCNHLNIFNFDKHWTAEKTPLSNSISVALRLLMLPILSEFNNLQTQHSKTYNEKITKKK